MLIEFTIENFRSIKDQVTLSMIATKDDTLDGNIIKNAVKDDALLKSAVIYGANASGKTNVLLGLNFLRMLVLNSHNHQKGQGIVFTPFKLEEAWTKKPTKLGIIFIKNNIRYSYSVSFNGEKIIEESLYYYPNEKRSLIFERNNTSSFEFTIDNREQKLISERTIENVLYLSKATQENYQKTAEPFDWFANNLAVIAATEHPAFAQLTANLIQNNPEMKTLVLKALLEADLGIDDLRATFKKVRPEDITGVPIPIVQEIFKDKPELDGFEVKTTHKGVEFDLQTEESEGTKKIFSIIGLWIDALRNGKVIVVDELDTKLHHLLNVFLLQLFHDETQNKANGQLIFTTHNLSLLDQDIFRRDQIWFTEKNPETRSTELYSLTEYSPRKDKDIQRGYLAGKYGALPFIKENRVF